MRGSVIFAGQLLPQLRFPLEFDYLDVTRYGDATRGGEISWKVTPGTSVAGRVVLVLDDILDEGQTLAAVREKLLEAGARQGLQRRFRRQGHRPRETGERRFRRRDACPTATCSASAWT